MANTSLDMLYWSMQGEVACAEHAPNFADPRWDGEGWQPIPRRSLGGFRYQCQHCAMPTVLLVHGDTADRTMYAEYLSGIGFDVAVAATTDVALQLVSAYDVLVTGLRVPGSLEPIALIRHVRRRSQHKRIVVVTACDVATLHDAALQAGCDELLLKPCLPDTLAGVIHGVTRFG